MHIDVAVESDGKMMLELYQLFFSWTREDEVHINEEQNNALENLTEDEIKLKAKQKEEDRKKREEFERDQALIEFEEAGGFAQVLKDIFNPSDMAAMELDSVYQLKNICKDFYRKKQLMSQALIETLDALSNERPTVLQMKRRHFNPDVASNKRESLEWMRINAERERIFRFKQIAKDTATQYYRILDRFTNELLNPSNIKSPANRSPDSPQSNHPKRREAQDGQPNVSTFQVHFNDTERTDSQNAATRAKDAPDNNRESETNNASAKMGKNFKQVMQAAYKENQLHNVVRFMTDYLRQVIENGSRFTSGHFFIMLLQLSSSEIKNNAAPYIRILAEELNISRE